MAEEILKFGGTAYHPSAANTGNENPTVLRGKNAILHGSEGSYYFRSFKGIKNLNEPIPIVQMSGTISYTEGSVEVTGQGTAFKEELRFGQKILTGNPLQVLVVEDIVDDEAIIVQRVPDASGTDEAAYKPAHLFDINNHRGTLIWGNAIKWDRGNITAVGEGRLRMDGEVLPGESLTATRRLQIALFDPATQQYDIGRMGFDSAPPANGVSISIVPGGTKNPSIGRYSFRYSWANSKTGYGFSNPSDVIKLDASSNPIAITATNQRFQLDFSAALPSRPANCDAIIIYRSKFTGAAESLVISAEGPWFMVPTFVKISDLEAGDITYVDVLDEEMSTLVTFDNDPPPNADWVTALAGDPILISCYGDTVVGGDDLGDAPGPKVSPARRGNRDGYPAAMAQVLSPPETIIGFVPALRRIFLMTKVGLPFAASTGQSDFPVETAAFWTTRFKSPYGLVFYNDSFYAFTIAGATKAIGTADKASEQTTFAAAVEDITRKWYAGYVHATYDPQNECIVFIYSASHRNEDGYWVSLALPFSLRHNCWMPLIEITKPNRDMVVTGAATIGSHLQFLAGGRGDLIDVFSEESSGEESSEEPGPDPNPLLDVLFACGFECGYLEQRSNRGGHYGGGGASNDFLISEDVVRTGRYSMRVASYVVWGAAGLGDSRAGSFLEPVESVVGRFYIYFEAFPERDPYPSTTMENGCWLWRSRTDGAHMGVFYRYSDGKIYAGAYNPSTLDLDEGASGVAVSLGQWIRIDLKCVQTVGARTMDVQVNGVACGQYSDASGSGGPSDFYFCHGPQVNGVWYIDDTIFSGNVADYPIGPGKVLGRIASRDGVHNINSAGRFTRGEGGANITNATTDAHQLIDERPMKEEFASANYDNDDAVVAVSGGASGDYVQVGFSAIAGDEEPELGPRAVEVVAICHRNTSNAGHLKVEINDNGSLGTVYDDTEAFSTIGGGFFYPFMARTAAWNPPSAADAWTTEDGDGNIDDLIVRFSSADAVYDNYLDAVMLECEYSE